MKLILTPLAVAMLGEWMEHMKGATMSHYQQRIMLVTGCTSAEATQAEEIMRHDIFHSTLDWQPAKVFDHAAKVAVGALKNLQRQAKDIDKWDARERELDA